MSEKGTRVYRGYKDGFCRTLISGDDGLWLLFIPSGDTIIVWAECKTLLGAKQAWGQLAGRGTEWVLSYSEASDG